MRSAHSFVRSSAAARPQAKGSGLVTVLLLLASGSWGGFAGAGVLAHAPVAPAQEPGVGSATDPAVAAVLVRAREALGWDRVAGHDGVVRVRGEARLLGTDALQTEFFDGRGRSLQTFEGTFPQQTGFDGETAWAVDWTGTARVLELGDRITAYLTSAFLNGGWTAAGDMLSFDTPTREGDEVVLAFEHASGMLGGTVRLDAETYLPRVVAWGEGENGLHWTLSSYADHGGFRYPGHVQLAQAGATQSLDTKSVEFVAAVDETFFDRRLGPPGRARFATDLPPELEVRQVSSGHLLVHPLVDGKDLGWFIFDTGAGTNCISTAVADELPEGPFGEVPAQGVGGVVMSRFWRAHELSLGPLTVSEPIFMGLDLAFLEAPFGVPVAGIIGYDFIARCAIEFDLTTPSIAIYDPNTYELAEEGAWEEAFLYRRGPCVRATFEGKRGVFKIDTGAAGDTVTMHYQAVQDLGLVEERETHAGSAGGVGGVLKVRNGEFESFELAGHEFGVIRASFADEDRGAFSDDFTLGNIGGKLIEPFVLVFDYPHKRIGFVPKGPQD